MDFLTSLLSALPYIVTILSLAGSALAIYISFKKYPPEIKNIDSGTDKIIAETNRISAETISAYAQELKTMKEDHKKEQEYMNKQLNEMGMEIKKLKLDIKNMTIDQEKERVLYRQFVNELLMGITRLTGQIQAFGQPPVWSAPSKTPFDCP